MALRSTCAELVSRLRDLIGDAIPATGQPVWSDDQLQRALDQRRSDVRYLELQAAETVQAGGTVVYLDYYAPRGDWEEDATLYDTQWAALTPATSDYQVGHWTFSATTLPPVLLIGKAFDLYATAADVLEQWQAKEKLAFGFSPGSNGGQFQEQQKFQMIGELSARYRAMQQPEILQMYRGDANADCC